MRIGYFGDGPWSHLAFAKLIRDPTLQIAFVCARHSKPDTTLKQLAANEAIPFFTAPNINSDSFRSQIQQFNCDLFVSMSFDQIFRTPILSLPPKGVVNCHAGRLPFYRGRNVLNWALINDEPSFGITLHQVDEGTDTGDIILQRTYEITDADDYGSVLEKAYVGCSEIVFDGIKLIQEDKHSRTPQSKIHPTGSYCSMRRAGDEILNWDSDSRTVFNFVRALASPGPLAQSNLGGHVFYIKKARLVPEAPSYVGIPGAILRKQARTLTVKTKDSFIEIVEWECESNPKTGDRLG